MVPESRPGRVQEAAWPANGSLNALRAEVASAVSGPTTGRDRRVGLALERYLGLPDLLSDNACRCSAQGYARHLLHADVDYTILALVWQPRQMSTVHAHQTWCAFGVHRGWLLETFFAPCPKGVGLRRCLPRLQGEISHAPAESEMIHRVANLGTETAVSIHVYGAAFDQLGDQVMRVWGD
jgi:3-mercaptopropionate dioxygenase